MKKINCPLCQKIITKDKLLYHFNRNHSKDFKTKEDAAKFNYNFHYGAKIIEQVINNYINGASLPDIKKMFGISFMAAIKILKANKISVRTSKMAMGSELRKDKFIKTCMEKYGVINVSQIEEVKEKKRETFIDHYGVDNIWKLNEYYVWLHQHMIDKYGQKSVPNINGNVNPFGIKTLTIDAKKIRMDNLHTANKKWWNALPEKEKEIFRNKRAATLLNNSPNRFGSKLETRVKSILDDHGIEYIAQFWIDRKSYDIKLTNTRVVIEIQGDYWHANPMMYNENDILRRDNKTCMAKDIWAKDQRKLDIAKKYNYNILYLWESELNNASDPEILSLIIKFINDKTN